MVTISESISCPVCGPNPVYLTPAEIKDTTWKLVAVIVELTKLKLFPLIVIASGSTLFGTPISSICGIPFTINELSWELSTI